MAPTPKRPFHTASDPEIKSGQVSDVYFQRTVQILNARNDRKRVKAEVYLKSLPEDWHWGVLAGIEEAAALFEGLPVDVAAMDEGTIFAPYQPVLTLEGVYVEWAQYETALLGLLCQASGIATKAARCKKAAGERQVISFGARRMHPTLAPMIERNAFIGGCDGVAVTKSAELIDADPMGTIPHSLVLMVGDTVEALRAFHEVIDAKVRRVALIDTLQDEKFEAIRVAEALGGDLYAVRLDTPSSRRGDFFRIIQEVRWELDIRGYGHVKIIASGGVDEYEILHLNPVVDAYGVGTSIANAPVLNFALDIMEIEGRPMAKRGKWSGAKDVLRSRPLAALRHGPSLDLHDVEREVEHGRVGNRRPDAVGIDHGVEMQDLVLVHSARRDDLHVAIAADIELPPHFLDDAEEVAAPGRRRIEADGVEIAPEGLGNADGLELLVLQRVDEGHPADLGVDDLVERAERLHRVTDHQHQRVRDRPHRIGVDELGRLGHGHAVAAADEGVALDHGRDGRMHAAGAERDHLPLTRRLLAAGRLGGDAGGLADQAEQGRLVPRPLDVGALERQHRLVRTKERALVHRAHRHRHTFEQRRGLVDAGQDAPLPVVGEALDVDLGLHALAVIAMPEDLDGPLEVHVRNVAALDLGVGCGVERAPRRGHSGPKRSGNFDRTRRSSQRERAPRAGLTPSRDSYGADDEAPRVVAAGTPG